MALRILLADDSMTAQNMGKKILVEGGYEVVTVSNGAAAVKKIAEHKPHLIILDVYMPGYTGLEVCERVKNAAETGRTPVLLTVGKMEPFKAEEGNRVKADGLLIKPFEATDLLAAVKKLSERVPAAALSPEVEAEETAPEPVVPEFADATYEEWKAGAAAERPQEPAAAPLQVPQEMAVTPAFGDFFGDVPDASAAEPPKAAESPAAEPAPAAHLGEAAAAAAAGVATPPPVFSAASPVFELEGLHAESPVTTPASGFDVEPVLAQASSSILEEAPPEPAAPLQGAPAPDLDLAALMSSTPPLELEPTAAPPQDVTTEPLAELEPTILQESVPVEVVPDPALVTEPEELMAFTTKFGIAEPAEEPVAAGEPEPLLEEPLGEIVTHAVDAQAAAENSALDMVLESEPLAEVAAPEEASPVGAEEAAVLEALEATEEIAVAPVEEIALAISDQQRIQEVLESAAEPEVADESDIEEILIPEELGDVLEPEPVLAIVPEPEPAADVAATPEIIAQVEPELVPEPEASAPVELEAPVTAALEPEPMPEPDTATAAPEPVTEPAPIVAELAAEHGVDEGLIARIVDRVVQRLKPELVSEIAKELKK